MSLSLRKHKRRAAAGMARRIARVTRNYSGPACHPYTVRLKFVLWHTLGGWWAHKPRRAGFHEDLAIIDFTRSVPRGKEYRG